jgi:hypothetical protein
MSGMMRWHQDAVQVSRAALCLAVSGHRVCGPDGSAICTGNCDWGLSDIDPWRTILLQGWWSA